MILPGLVTKELEREAERLQADADETFGAHTVSVRIILGVAIGALADAGGMPATIAYLNRVIGVLRKADDETQATPPPAPAS